MRKLALVLIVFVLGLLGAEVFLRTYYGFCDAVLVQEDPDMEYIVQPDQDRFRFRNHDRYNAYSMRSDEVDTTALRILGFGDSVINGGTQTDQDSLATSILSDSLSKRLGKRVQFLNISAGSWGPDNCFAYLKRYGNFGASAIYLFVSSHDAYDNMDFQKIVDLNESFPSKQYHIAWVELFERYLIPRLDEKFGHQNKQSSMNGLGINKKKPNSTFNTGFADLLEYAKEHSLPFTIYLHADLNEAIKGAYNNQGEEIIKFATGEHIPLILDLGHGVDPSCYRDGIHFNSKGQRKMAELVLRSWADQPCVHHSSDLSPIHIPCH